MEFWKLLAQHEGREAFAVFEDIRRAHRRPDLSKEMDVIGPNGKI